MKAYRDALAESDRIYLAGGADGLTKAMRAVATGSYLELTKQGISIAHAHGWRLSQPGKLVYVAPQGWSPSKIHLKACEDGSKARILDNKNRDRTPPGSRRYVQDYTVVKTASGWKVAAVETREVLSFRQYGCGVQ